MWQRINLKKLAQKVEESKGASSAAKLTPTAKGIVIREKCPRDEAPDVTPGEMGSKGKEVMPPPKAKKKAKSTPNEAVIMEAPRPVAPREGHLDQYWCCLGAQSHYAKKCCHGRKTS